MDSSDDESPTTMARASSAPLGRRAVHGALWAILGRGFDQLANFIKFSVLFHLLYREQIGAYTVVQLISMGLLALTFTGFRLGLVRRTKDPADLYDTAFVVELGRGLFLAALLFVAAPYLADYFRAPVTWLLRAECIALILHGAINIGTIEFDRSLNFKKTVLMTRSATVVSLVAGVSLAAIRRDVWALVLADILYYSTLVALSYWLHPYRPRLRFRFDYFKELFSFGVWLTINAIGFFLLLQFDSFFVAKWLGLSALALYQAATKLAMLLVNGLREAISMVTFPVFSRIHEDPQRMARAFAQVFAALSAVVAPAASLLACFSPEFLFLTCGPQAVDAAPILRILAWFGLVQMVVISIEPIFQALGSPHLTTFARYCHIAILIPTVWLLVSWKGAIGAAIAVTLAGLVPMVILAFFFRRQVPGTARPVARNLAGLAPPLAALASVAMLIRSTVPPPSLDAAVFSGPWWGVLAWTVAGVTAAGGAYLAVLAIVEWKLSIGIRQVIQQVRSGVSKPSVSAEATEL